MRKTKTMLVAVSAIAMAGMTTACSKYKKATPRQESSAALAVEQPQNTGEALILKMEANDKVGANLQAIIEKARSGECDSATLNSMVNQGNQTEKILSESTNYRGKELAFNQILKKSNDKNCQANAIAEVAKQAKVAYDHAFSDEAAVAEGQTTEQFDTVMNNTALIVAVLGPAQNKVDNELNALAAVQEQREKHGEVSSRIDLTLSTIEDQFKVLANETLACDMNDCDSERKSAMAYMNVANNAINRATSDLDRYEISANDENISAKTAVLEERLSSLQQIRDTSASMIKNITNESVAVAEKGPNAKNGNAGSTEQTEEFQTAELQAGP